MEYIEGSNKEGKPFPMIYHQEKYHFKHKFPLA